MSAPTTWDADASAPVRIPFKVVRSFKALDDGQRRKWVLVVRLQDLPANLPLDANARVPNVIRNRTCAEMRATLLNQPELFQVFNGGIVCTAQSLEIKQVENATFAEVTFDQSGGQGVVNGGHSYAAALLVAHNITEYSDGKDLIAVLADDLRKGVREVSSFVNSEHLLMERVARARQMACIQMEVVAPIPDADLLAQVARARNLSQSVEATALANLAGKYDHLKTILADAYGEHFVGRVVWKTNQKPPEDTKRIPVNDLHYVLALMNVRAYHPGLRVPTEVFSRPGLIIREYVEAEGEQEQTYRRLERALPLLLELYDHIYLGIAKSDPAYPWTTGRLEEDVRRRPTVTPFFGDPCPVKVDRAFVWPVFAAFRQLLVESKSGDFDLLLDPLALFDEKCAEIVDKLKSFHQENARGLLQVMGRDKELWIRLESIVEMEVRWRRRDGSLGVPSPCRPRRQKCGRDRQEFVPTEEEAYRSGNAVTNRRPTLLRFRGQSYPVSTWKELYVTSAALLARMYPTQFDPKAQELMGRIRRYFSRSRDGMHAPEPVPGTKLFMETCFSAEATQQRVAELFQQFGHLRGEWNVELE